MGRKSQFNLLKVRLRQLSAAGRIETPFAPDLTYSHGILDAIEDLHSQPDVGVLLSAVADYGTTITPADGIAIFICGREGWRPAVIRAAHDKSDVGVEQVVELLAAEGWFQHVNRVDDLSQDQRWGQLRLPAACELGGRFSSLPRNVKTMPIRQSHSCGVPPRGRLHRPGRHGRPVRSDRPLPETRSNKGGRDRLQ
jgi:hypothetical protein